ncbi:unnamed protein product, partial [Ectocarpus fasciculatus]
PTPPPSPPRQSLSRGPQRGCGQEHFLSSCPSSWSSHSSRIAAATTPLLVLSQAPLPLPGKPNPPAGCATRNTMHGNRLDLPIRTLECNPIHGPLKIGTESVCSCLGTSTNRCPLATRASSCS